MLVKPGVKHITDTDAHTCSFCGHISYVLRYKCVSLCVCVLMGLGWRGAG